MKTDAVTGALVPFDFSAIYDEFPSLKRLNVDIDVHTVSPVIDSSNVEPAHWIALAELIRDNYARYDGFVVLHGTDAMSYTGLGAEFHARKPQQTGGFHREPDPDRRAAHRRAPRTSSRPSKSPERISTAGPWFPKCRSISRTGSSAPTAPPSAAPRP